MLYFVVSVSSSLKFLDSGLDISVQFKKKKKLKITFWVNVTITLFPLQVLHTAKP